ncbi:Uncharacterised protein [uncultured archaeon]|nr:Uncharacterised protein [uncultured archaeon]
MTTMVGLSPLSFISLIRNSLLPSRRVRFIPVRFCLTFSEMGPTMTAF